MPYISTRTSTPIPPDKELAIKAKLGNAIELLPGKTESWLMTEFTGSCHLYFQGTNEKPSAYVEVKAFGKINDSASEKLTNEICKIITEELSIPMNRIYVKYEETDKWGWNGNNL